MIAKSSYEPAGFKLNLGLKDIGLALEAAGAMSVPMPIASVVRDQFLTGIARGYQDLDWAALGRVCAEDAGIT
jgi:3-hydroxyisobutyrate dehydrogenase-like beta-hydroxyacid dehydrogenase